MTNNIKPIIIIILIIGGIFIISKMGYKPEPQATQELEPVRGQTIWEDFESGIMPCPVINVGKQENPDRISTQWGIFGGTDIAHSSINGEIEQRVKQDYGDVKCALFPHGFITSGFVKIENGELVMHGVQYSPDVYLYIFEDLRNADISIYYELEGPETISISYGEISDYIGVTSKQGVIKISHDIIEGVYSNIAGREEEIIIGEIPFYIRASGTGEVRIDEIRYSKPFTTCLTDETTIIYKDKFGPDSTIRWVEPSTFDYEPLRFCYDIPAWKFEDGQFAGTDFERASLTRKLSRGEEHQVASNEEFYVFYVTPYVEGMGEKCELGEAKDENNDCVKRRYEAPITIFQCETKADCPVPPSCDPETVICLENNLCKYEGVECKNEVIVRQEIIEMIVEKKVPIFVADKEFLFTSYSKDNNKKTSFMVGDKSIEQTPFDDFNEQYIDRIECLVLDITNETVWDMQCKYRVDMSFLSVTNVDGFKQILLNSEDKISVEVENDYVNFNNVQSGFVFDCFRIYGLQEDLRSKTMNNGFNEGINIYGIDVYDDLIGEYICDLIPYIEIKADETKRFFVEEKRFFTYLAVNEIIDFGKIDFEEIPDIEEKIEEETEKFKLSDIPVIAWVLGIGLILWWIRR